MRETPLILVTIFSPKRHWLPVGGMRSHCVAQLSLREKSHLLLVPYITEESLTQVNCKGNPESKTAKSSHTFNSKHKSTTDYQTGEKNCSKSHKVDPLMQKETEIIQGKEGILK